MISSKQINSNANKSYKDSNENISEYGKSHKDPSLNMRSWKSCLLRLFLSREEGRKGGGETERNIKRRETHQPVAS